jgi:acyl-CoA synthetase (NDP forming)
MAAMVVDYSKFDSLFHPSSIAMVGASSDHGGAFMMDIMLEYGFRGKVYPVNLRGGEVLGLKAYLSIKDIPEPVDYAFLQVPARAAIQVIRDCAAKGVKLAALFSAGFGEGDKERGTELEQELVSIARQGGVRLLGPNCMGFYCPAARVTFCSPRESGTVGALCQSGGNSIQLVRSAVQRGIRFSKIISYGNAADINEADLLEYFAEDPETKVIIAYVEGVKDGRRFFQALKAAAQAKPVIMLKGGQSEAGAAAAFSHTGSLAGARKIWDSLLKQAGTIQAYSIEECLDIALALLLMKPPHSRSATVIGYGGGATVLAADDCYRAELFLPPLPQTIKDELKKVIPVTGNILINPVDFTLLYLSPEKMAQIVRIVGSWPGVDLLILHLRVELTDTGLVEQKLLEPLAEAFIGAAKEVNKPTALVVHAVYSVESYQGFLKVQQMCFDAGLPCYPSIQRAASAIDKIIRYHQTK